MRSSPRRINLSIAGPPDHAARGNITMGAAWGFFKRRAAMGEEEKHRHVAAMQFELLRTPGLRGWIWPHNNGYILNMLNNPNRIPYEIDIDAIMIYNMSISEVFRYMPWTFYLDGEKIGGHVDYDRMPNEYMKFDPVAFATIYYNALTIAVNSGSYMSPSSIYKLPSYSSTNITHYTKKLHKLQLALSDMQIAAKVAGFAVDD